MSEPIKFLLSILVLTSFSYPQLVWSNVKETFNWKCNDHLKNKFSNNKNEPTVANNQATDEPTVSQWFEHLTIVRKVMVFTPFWDSKFYPFKR